QIENISLTRGQHIPNFEFKSDVNQTSSMPQDRTELPKSKLNNLNIMKKTIVLGIILFNLIYTSVRADGGIKISEQVKASFRKEFVNAEQVRWESSGENVKAIFSIDSQILSAYFHMDGELIAVTRNISSSELPIHLLITLKNDYP